MHSYKIKIKIYKRCTHSQMISLTVFLTGSQIRVKIEMKQHIFFLLSIFRTNIKVSLRNQVLMNMDVRHFMSMMSRPR